MNVNPPHDIQFFDDGNTIPEGYTSLTIDEFNLLNDMTPDQRGEWLRKNKVNLHDLFQKENNG